MGLFDRFLGGGRSSAGQSGRETASAEEAAARLLEEGMALEEDERTEEALQRYEAAIRQMPALARAHFNRGNILLDRGDAKAALDAYRKAVEYKPDSAGAHYNLGNACIHLGRYEDAVAAYRQAAALKPGFVEAALALGRALQDLGKLEEAAASYRQVVELAAGHVEAHSRLGFVLHNLGRLDEAAASYRQALAHQPDLVEAHGNLGNVLKDLRQLDLAIASYSRVLEIQPDSAEAYNNLGNALKDLGRIDEALESYRRALEIRPDFAVAHSNLLFTHNYQDDLEALTLVAKARRYGEMVARQARPPRTRHNVPDPDRCLRVGLVSGDLRQHPVGNFLEGVLAALVEHAAGRLAFFGYPSHGSADEVTGRIKVSCRGWFSIEGISDEDAAKRIQRDEIDILIDLSGHTSGNRLPLFAWQPAPVEATWLGYLATTGVAAMDYLIADTWTLPASEEAHFTEKIWRLPTSYLCFTPPESEVQTSSLPATGNGYVTFGSFNNLSKVNDRVIALWARVLSAVPGSRLYLKAGQFKEAPVRQCMAERFLNHGIDAGRLILEGHIPRAEYLRPFQRIDIALDPFPYPGITTSVENLWMGVPVLTLAGQSFMSRQGVGLMMNAGLPDWIAADADDYVARAVAHAGDLPRLAALRAGLRQQVLASPIFDASRFARHFESALRGMWREWCGRQQERS